MLLKYGANINTLNDLGHPPIYYVRTKTLMKIFLKNNANINYVDIHGNNLLHNHVLNNSTKGIIKVLINNGLNINSVNFNGDTPLHYVQNIDIAHALLFKNNIANLQNINDETPLHNILKLYNNDVIDLINIFVDYEDIINIQDKNGNTPLHIFCYTLNNIWKTQPNIDKNIAFIIIGNLLKHNADILKKNNYNMKPFDIILQEQHTMYSNIFQCLLQEIKKYIQDNNNDLDYINSFNKLCI
jgi:ankyrin repeat protein